MPEPKRLAEDDIEAWITVGGKKIPLAHGEEKDTQVKHKLTTVGGEKSKNTTETGGSKEKTEEPRSEKETKKMGDEYATSDTGTRLSAGDKVKIKKVGDEPVTPEKHEIGDWKTGWDRMIGQHIPKQHEYENTAEIDPIYKYEQRHGLIKSKFEPRDVVYYDKTGQIGLVAGTEGNHVRILTKNNTIVTLHKDYVYRAAEMTKYGHWDAMGRHARLNLLKDYNLNTEYINVDWGFLPEPIKKIIVKAQGPSGYEGAGINTVTRGVYNPVTSDKTLSQRVEEEKKKTTKTSGANY